MHVARTRALTALSLGQASTGCFAQRVTCRDANHATAMAARHGLLPQGRGWSSAA